MYPPGSGAPPTITAIVNTCTTGGGSRITFNCNKAISSSILAIQLVEVGAANPVWSDGFGESVNARSFEILGTANGSYELYADNGEASATVSVIVNCAGGTGGGGTGGALHVVRSTVTQPTIATPTGTVLFIIGGAITRPVIITGQGWNAINFDTGTNQLTTQVDNTEVFSQRAFASGTYRASLRDSSNPANTGDISFIIDPVPIGGCTNPLASNYNPLATVDDGTCVIPPPVVKARFLVPLLNSLRYVRTSPDALPNLDNRLYCNEDWPGIFKLPYYQKVCRGDTTATQFQSNYTTHVAKLYDYITGAAVATLNVSTVRQNTGIATNYTAWLTAHPGNANQSRLYFHGGKLPIVFVAGDTVNLVNATPSGVNGARAVAEVTFSNVDSIPFLVLDLVYPGGGPRVSLNVRTTYDAQPYNVHQFATNWDGIAQGVYIIRITATHATYPTVECISEPIALQLSHPNTHLLTWRGFNDAHGLVFSKGLICGLRVESDLIERQPGGTRKVMDLPNGRALKLGSTLRRRADFNLKNLPPYLHEKIGFLFDLDHIEINEVEYVTRDNYSADTSKTFALRNGSITVDEVGGEPQNTTDLGDVLAPATGYIIATNNQRLRR